MGIAPFLFPEVTKQKGQGRKQKMKTAMVAIFAFLSLAVRAQFVDQTTTVIVNTPARYQLVEGVDVAISNVIKKGKVVSLKNVLKELEEMQRARDVKLPYSYDMKFSFSSGGKSKSSRRISAENQRRKTEFETLVKRRIDALVAGANVQDVDVCVEPKPRDFKSRDEFIKAYVTHKMGNVDDETKEKYAKRLGGLSQYKRDMKNEATKLWKESQL